MIPDESNVYGRLFLPQGLVSLKRTLVPLFKDGEVYICASEVNGAKTLHIQTYGVDMETVPMAEKPRHQFSGAFGGTDYEVVLAVRRISDALTAAGIRHLFEVYDWNENLIAEVPVRA